MKRPILIFTVVLIIAIAGVQYFNISICSPFNLEKNYSTVLNCQIIGIVIEEQKETESYYKYVIKLEKNDANIKNNTKILLRVKKGKSKLNVGNEILVNCILEVPDGSRNYGGYDYKLYLKTQGIYATTKITESDYKILSENKLSFVNYGIYKIKSTITNNLTKLLSEDTKGVCIGILLGDIKYVSDETKEAFDNSNLLHMLAVSGSHVSYILVSATKCLKKVDKRFQKWLLIVFLIFFIKITGATSSVMRAGIMGILILLSWIFKRKSDVLNNIAISCLIILLINPYSLYSLGFQLSYAGTLGIIFYYNSINNFINKIAQPLIIFSQKNLILNKFVTYVITTLSVSISANILIMPILLYNNNNVSFVFLISNILVSSLFGIILFLSFFITIISFISIDLAKIVAPLLDISIKILNFQTTLSAKFARFDILIPTPSIITLIFIYTIIFLIKNSLISKEKSKKLIKISIIIYVCITLILSITGLTKKELNLYFIDVGQGDSTLIVTEQNKKILIDGGGSNTDLDVGKKTLLPYLLDRKIMSLDYVIISHFDSDHCKGIFTIMQNLKVKNACISSNGQESENYDEFLKIAEQRKINIIMVNAGDNIKIDKYTSLEILWTGDNTISENVINNYSIVFKLNYRNKKMLFTGDIEAIAEEKMASLYNKGELKADILKVAHHGSKSSSTQKFIELVSPKIALIGVGKNNLFGHPNPGVIERLQNSNIHILRTDQLGETQIKIKKDSKIQILSTH